MTSKGRAKALEILSRTLGAVRCDSSVGISESALLDSILSAMLEPTEEVEEIAANIATCLSEQPDATFHFNCAPDAHARVCAAYLRPAVAAAITKAVDAERIRITRSDFDTQICLFCGWETKPGGASWEELQAHVEVCEKHPMKALREKAATLEADLDSHKRVMAIIREAAGLRPLDGVSLAKEVRRHQSLKTSL